MENKKLLYFYALNMCKSLTKYPLEIRRNFVKCFIVKHGEIPDEFIPFVLKMVKD